MNDQFDELAKGLAQSVTRRGALKQFGLGLAGIALASIFAGRANAADLYADASVTVNGNGTAAEPYWRITDAVARARVLRQTAAIPLNERITIHVAPGTYHGSYDARRLAAQPRMEVLPIILNVPNLTLSGATVLDTDAQGLPTRVHEGPETILTAQDPQLFDIGYALIVVTRTTDGGVGNGVTVAGFGLKQKTGSADNILCCGIFVDRVSDFVIRGNAFVHDPHGLITRLASGVVEGNLFNCDLFGFVISGGSMVQPAAVTLRRNRSASKIAGGGFLCGIAEMRRLNPGANSRVLEPLQALYDRNNPLDVLNIPDTLHATVTGNDFSDSPHFGLRVFANSPYIYTTADSAQPVTSVVNTTVTGNSFSRNGDYGIAADAGFAQRDLLKTRTLTTVLTGSFASNLYVGNARSPALFTFNNYWVTVGRDDPQPVGYLNLSTYQITDAGSELAGFDYDNPVADPFDGTVLNNTLIVNGAVIPPGITITP